MGHSVQDKIKYTFCTKVTYMTPYQNSTSAYIFIYIHNMPCLLLVKGSIFSRGCIFFNATEEKRMKLRHHADQVPTSPVSFNAQLSNSCCFVHFRKSHSLGNEKENKKQ